MFGPFDRELPSNVSDIKFEPSRSPGVHLPEGEDVNTGSPSALFLLFFHASLISEIMKFTNMKGKVESEKVNTSNHHHDSIPIR